MINESYREKGLRRNLICQLREKGIRAENVLAAMGKVPRHTFFDPALLSHAYKDKAFPIGEGQTISQPFTVAFQTEKLNINKGDKVLEIGTGSGYQACILLEMGAKVYTIEYNRNLFERAQTHLSKLGYYPYFIFGDGSKGLPSKSPYQKIIVTAGAPSIPNALTKQLAEGGVLIIPVGDRRKQMMIKVVKKDGKLIKEEYSYFSFVPLRGDKGWKE